MKKKDFKLHKAVVDGNLELVKELISNGFDVNEKDNNLLTPLHYACQNYSNQKENYEIAKALISAGCDIEAKDNFGNTPLSDAVYWFENDPLMIKLLLENGADKSNENNYGISPYTLAESIANHPVLQYLK